MAIRIAHSVDRTRSSVRHAISAVGLSAVIALTSLVGPGSARPVRAAEPLIPAAQLDDAWGTWLPERSWGTPREAVGTNGWGLDWTRAIGTDYRYMDDGIAGWTDRSGTFRLGWAFWDGVQPHVTERFDGDTNPDGAAGETIRDDRVFHENGPRHAYTRLTYRYPEGSPTFSIELEGARIDDDRIALRATVTNITAEPAALDVLLKGWLAPDGEVTHSPGTLELHGPTGAVQIAAYWPATWQVSDAKDAIDANLRAGGLAGSGAGHIGALGAHLEIAPGETQAVRAVVDDLTSSSPGPREALADVDDAIAARRAEAETLFRRATPAHEELYRAALMSLLWSESYYAWDGATAMDPRFAGTVDAHDVLIMPDKWEYPWLASWDSAFQAVTAALIEPELGADQLRFILSDRWQAESGHVPCAEWVMANECPPIFAWAALRVAAAYPDPAAGDALLGELAPALRRLYDYWWNHLQAKKTALFWGGFLGMDNLPGRSIHAQADASGWMAMLARDLATIEDRLGDAGAADRYRADRERIATAVNATLWDEAQGFYFDATDNAGTLLRTAPSYSGLVPLIAGIVPQDRLAPVLDHLRDPDQFLSPGGIRSLSAASTLYVPGPAGRGANSNWRGPVWVPLNLLLVEALESVDPALAVEVRTRVVENVEADWSATGRFHEFFDGDTGAGLGADFQTGWTAMVANLIADGWPR